MTAGGFDLSGRTVLVTGAAKRDRRRDGPGLRRAGARVVLVDREDAALLADEVGGMAFRADVARRAEVAAAARLAQAPTSPARCARFLKKMRACASGRARTSSLFM